MLNVSLSDHNRLFLTVTPSYFFPIGFVAAHRTTRATSNQQVMPDDYSKLVPPLPIPNRTVKRLCADDSAATSVKVGHRQAFIPHRPKFFRTWGFCFCANHFATRFKPRISVRICDEDGCTFRDGFGANEALIACY